MAPSDSTFGRFPSVGAFLISYEAALQAEAQEADTALPTLAAKIQKQRNQRSLVEAKATVLIHEPNDDDPDGGQHLRLRINLDSVSSSDERVNTDVQRCLTSRDEVFVAVRIGDSMGILNPPTTGLEAGDQLHLRGEWIPRERAYSHGGRKVSVLHFTHHPIGFICTVAPTEKCYS
jgi:hypothetical protein